jgi:hypothetical protein
MNKIYRSYLPHAVKAFREWVNSFFTILGSIYSSLGIDPTAYQQLLQQKQAWDLADAAASDPLTATKPVVHERARVLKVFTKAIRAFVSEFLLHNHLLTPLQREELGLTPENPPSPDPAPQKAPRAELITNVHGQVTAHCQGEETKWGMEAGAHGFEWRWAILAAPPTRHDELTHSEFSTRAHHTMTFDLDQRGQRIYSAFRWENEKGEKGPWSDVLEAIIP